MFRRMISASYSRSEEDYLFHLASPGLDAVLLALQAARIECTPYVVKTSNLDYPLDSSVVLYLVESQHRCRPAARPGLIELNWVAAKRRISASGIIPIACCATTAQKVLEYLK